jgi:hypothetical protein
LFGLEPGSTELADAMGLRAPGAMVTFDGTLEEVESQVILTDFLVDRIYPLAPADSTEIVATAKGHVVGTHRETAAGGQAVCFGFRPRDDQSGSLGYPTDTWFGVLDALGSYAPSGKFVVNDNPTVMSRTSDYVACEFPNGAVTIAPHFHSIEEFWEGGFARSTERDAEVMARLDMPSNTLDLYETPVAGHEVSYDGDGFVAFRMDAEGDLVAFGGTGSGITVDGKEYQFTEAPAHFAFAPVAEERRVPGGATLLAIVYGEHTVRVPVKGLGEAFDLFAQGDTPGSRGEQIACTTENGVLTFTVPASASGRWLYAVPRS